MNHQIPLLAARSLPHQFLAGGREIQTNHYPWQRPKLLISHFLERLPSGVVYWSSMSQTESWPVHVYDFTKAKRRSDPFTVYICHGRLLLGVRLVVLPTLPESLSYPVFILSGALWSRIHHCREEGLLLALLTGKKKVDYNHKVIIEPSQVYSLTKNPFFGSFS